MSARLYKMIREGEHQGQDFKFCINDSKKIARSLVAFANTDGGRLLIGVKDNGKIAGISSDEEFYMVEAAAKIYSKPAIRFTTQQHFAEGKTVLEITIDPSSDKPHYAQDDNEKWLAYYRKDDENKLVNKVMIEVWKKKSGKQGILIKYSDNEKCLLDWLEKKQFNLCLQICPNIAYLFSKSRTNHHRFYCTRNSENRFQGRQNFLFAQRKFQPRRMGTTGRITLSDNKEIAVFL